MKLLFLAIFISVFKICYAQHFDTASYNIKVQFSKETDKYFTNDPVWRGADGASSIDMGNGKVLWLFSDSFICSDSSGLRNKSKIIRNSIAIQSGHDLKNAPIKYYWNKSRKNSRAFFHNTGKFWFWTGHGTMIKDKLIIFLLKVHRIEAGLAFETFGWYVVLISNPADDPSKWKMKYVEGPETYGLIAGSAAVLKDNKYLYAYGAVEPATHEVYLLRWDLDNAYKGNVTNPEWWINGNWQKRENLKPLPKPLFIGGTEYSVHYDTSLRKFIQIQAFGFGAGKIGLRMSDNLEGDWTDLHMFYVPEYPGVKEPFMYAAKAHPELTGDGTFITYNVNSFNFGELLQNETIYFPRFILLKIEKK